MEMNNAGVHKIKNDCISRVYKTESIYIRRLAKRMEKHKCSCESVQTCYIESLLLKRVSEYPEMRGYINTNRFKYAFKL